MPWWGLGAALTAWSIGVVTMVIASPGAPWLGVGLVATLVVAVMRRAVPLALAIAVIAAFLLGLGRAALAEPTSLPPGVAGQAVTLEGVVDDDPVVRNHGQRLTISVRQLLLADGVHDAPIRVQTTVYGRGTLNAGDQVLVAGKLEEPVRFEQFDYRTFLADEGIAGVLASARLVRSSPGTPDPIHAGIFAVRHALVSAIDRLLPEPEAALVLGVVFGYRAALPSALQQQMITSGLIHIVVISGLKVSLLARLVQRSVGRLWPSGAPVVALTAMVGYALVAGASAAAIRAAAMGALVVIAGFLRRDSHVYVSMALAAACMLGLKPALAHDVSFELSFAGTLGIASLTDPIAARIRWMPALLRDPFAATVAAEAATWPLMLANFHQLSLVGPVANALVLPLLPAIIVVGGAGALIAIAAPLCGWPLLHAAGMIAGWYEWVITTTARLPGAALVAPYFPGRWLAAASVLNGGALAALKLRVFFWQRRVWAVLGGLALIVVVLLLIRPDGRLHVYALDVGTGSAVLVRTPSGNQVLVDAGPDPDLLAQALGRALPPTARRIRVFIVTGGRLAEIGGAGTILDRFQVDRLVVADPDPWTPTLRALVDRAQAAGIVVEAGIAPVQVDGVQLSPLRDQRTWMIRQGRALLAIVPPDTDWQQLPPGLDGAIFTDGGPNAWDVGATTAFAVIQVTAHSRAGLPAHAFLNALGYLTILRTDRIGSVELAVDGSSFVPAA